VNVVVQGMEHAPTLRNYLQRQTYTVRTPRRLRAAAQGQQAGDPVLVVPKDFEADLARGVAPTGGAGVQRRQPARADRHRGRVRLLRGFNQEQATLRLAVRGVSPAALEALRIEGADLADPATRAAQLSTMVPFFVLMAVLYGA
jgi:sodium transport system permease protein